MAQTRVMAAAAIPHGNAASDRDVTISRLLLLHYEERLNHLESVETKRGALNPKRRSGKLHLARDRMTTTAAKGGSERARRLLPSYVEGKRKILGALRKVDHEAIPEIQDEAARYAGKERRCRLSGFGRRHRAALWACEDFCSPGVMAEFPYLLSPPPFHGQTFTLKSAWKRVEAAKKLCNRHPGHDDPGQDREALVTAEPGSEGDALFTYDALLASFLYEVLILKPFTNPFKTPPPRPRRVRNYTPSETESRLAKAARKQGLTVVDKPTEEALLYCQEHGFDSENDETAKWIEEAEKNSADLKR